MGTRVNDVMTRSVIACQRTDNLNTAAQLMWDHDCGAIPVLDPYHRVVGMITDRDCCMSAYLHGENLGAIPVVDAMSADVVSCHFEDSIERAEQLMASHKVRRLPVVDDFGAPVGILSMNDIARHAARAKDAAMASAAVKTMATVCAPRGA
jgi:CBS-domain-containing membrane protein